MNHSPTPRPEPRGSALITVIFLIVMMGLLTTSLLKYSGSERRGNERNRLILRAKNAAENTTVYAAEQLTQKLLRLGTTPVMRFPWTGTGSLRVYLPPDQVLDTSFTSHNDVEMRCGILAASGLVLDTDTSSPNYGLQVNIAKVPIIAKAKAHIAALGEVTTYVQQDMAIALTPLFQFGMFYNMDLELYPSAAMTISGPVHTNGRLMVHTDGGGTHTILFTDRVTSVGGVYADAAMKTVTRGGSGAQTTVVLANGHVMFTHTNGTQTSLKNNTSVSAGAWRDHKFTTTAETSTTVSNFRTFATNTYNGNLRTGAHGVTSLELPGIGGYKEQNVADNPDPNNKEDVDERSNGRQIIEPPNALKWAWDTSTNTGAWTTDTDGDGDTDANDGDTSEQKKTKISWRAGLYIISNPTSTIRTCTLPDLSTASLLPYSYRAFLNTTTIATGAHTMAEVVLPGQPSYGYNNNGTTGTTDDDTMYRNYLPNRYTVNNSVAGNQVLRIPQQEFGMASGYLLNGAHGSGVTTLTIDSGSGPIPVGETVTIKGFKYLVTAALSGGTIKIMAGLRGAVADNEPVTVDVASSNPGTGRDYQINNGSGYGTGSNVLTVDTGTGTIPIGNYVTIVGKKYLVTATTGSPVTSITISPGLTVACLDNAPVSIDSMSGTVGTGTGYLTNGAFAQNVSRLNLDTGTGTILPGNVITIGANKYLVTSAISKEGGAPSYINIAPGIIPVGGVADNTAVTIDPALGTHKVSDGRGYLTSAAVIAGAITIPLTGGAGSISVGDTIALAHKQYLVTSVAGGTPATSVTIASGLINAAGNGDHVMIDSYRLSGYARSGGTGNIFPEDSAAITYPAEAYFFDIRRANSNRGVISLSGTDARYDRLTIPYYPRPIAKVDFDMTRFKMMFDRVINAATQSLIYDPRAPNTGGLTWGNSIFNSATSTVRANFGLGMVSAAYTTFPTSGSVASQTRQDPSQLYYVPNTPDAANIFSDPTAYPVPIAALYNAGAPSSSAWYDGIAIYLHSLDAEVRAQVNGVPRRNDSGVRLWNGRGPLPSVATVGKQGFTFVTNDAVYIIGHFNANGATNATTSSSGFGGFSARWPDSSEEQLAAVMGDAFTAISQPYWDSTTSGQTKGWNDAFSALPASSTSAGWRTMGSTTAALTGSQDGLYITAGYFPGLLPNNNTPGTIGTSSTTKLLAYDTEMSTALLVGIVPTNHSPGYVAGAGAVASTWAVTDGYVPTWTHAATGDPVVKGNRVNAGGANNFPRLLEDWKPGGTAQTLFIRGSMVAMYECRVAMEPFTNSRCYSAPNRTWGLHQDFRTVDHDLPLEPILLGSTRLGFRELTPAEYDTMKGIIEALPASP